MKLRNTLFAILVAAIPAMSLAQVEMIPRASFFGNPSKVQGLISPDGKWISWIAPRDGVLNIWVAPSSDPAKAKPLTEEKVRPIRQHFWARKSKTILFINDRGGDENFLLYGVSPEGGAMKSYTQFQKTRVIPIGGSRKRVDDPHRPEQPQPAMARRVSAEHAHGRPEARLPERPVRRDGGRRGPERAPLRRRSAPRRPGRVPLQRRQGGAVLVDSRRGFDHHQPVLNISADGKTLF
jgi:hypothetical protein